MTRRKVTRNQPPKPPVDPHEQLARRTRAAIRKAQRNPTHENLTAAFAYTAAQRLLQLTDDDDDADGGVVES